jgi:hypothetical protein
MTTTRQVIRPSLQPWKIGQISDFFRQHRRVGPGNFTPHRSGLDTLASSGSCHRTKAALNIGFLLDRRECHEDRADPGLAQGLRARGIFTRLFRQGFPKRRERLFEQSALRRA